MNEKLDLIENIIKMLGEINVSLFNKITELSTQNKAISNTNDCLKKQLDSLNENFSELKKDLSKQFVTSTAELKKSINVFNEKNDQLSNELQEKDNTIETLKAQINNLNSTVDEKKAQIDNLNSTVDEIKEKLTNAENDITTKDATIADQTTKIEELQHELKETKKLIKECKIKHIEAEPNPILQKSENKSNVVHIGIDKNSNDVPHISDKPTDINNQGANN